MTQPAKKRKNSRAKGKAYERVVAKKLGDWWGEPFRSTPGSGALHWEKDNRVTGDIVPPPDSLFPFSVECKKREGWYFDSIINQTGEVFSWWEQSIGDAARVDKEPLLIFSKNRAPSYAMLEWELFVRLGLENKPYFKCDIPYTWENSTSTDTVGITNIDNLTSIERSIIIEECLRK